MLVDPLGVGGVVHGEAAVDLDELAGHHRLDNKIKAFLESNDNGLASSGYVPDAFTGKIPEELAIRRRAVSGSRSGRLCVPSGIHMVGPPIHAARLHGPDAGFAVRQIRIDDYQGDRPEHEKENRLEDVHPDHAPHPTQEHVESDD